MKGSRLVNNCPGDRQMYYTKTWSNAFFFVAYDGHADFRFKTIPQKVHVKRCEDEMFKESRVCSSATQFKLNDPQKTGYQQSQEEMGSH